MGRLGLEGHICGGEGGQCLVIGLDAGHVWASNGTNVLVAHAGFDVRVFDAFRFRAGLEAYGGGGGDQYKETPSFNYGGGALTFAFARQW
jgi:hypothetical protein